jgi:hypothetical protein
MDSDAIIPSPADLAAHAGWRQATRTAELPDLRFHDLPVREGVALGDIAVLDAAQSQVTEARKSSASKRQA